MFCVQKGITLRAQPLYDGRKKGHSQTGDSQTVDHSEFESRCERPACSVHPLCPKTSGYERRSACSDYVGDCDGDHHDRIGQVDRRQLVIISHQTDKKGVNHVVENHDEHARDQRHPQPDHCLYRFFLAQDIYPAVFFYLLLRRLFCHACCVVFRIRRIRDVFFPADHFFFCHFL